MQRLPFRILLAAVLATSTFAHAIDITPAGAGVAIAPGEVTIAGATARVAKATTLPIAPSPEITIADEPVKLSVDKPVGWAKGTRLRGPNARDVNAAGSFVPGSLQLRRTPGGELLVLGEDYLVDEEWGHVGLGPSGKVTAQDTVFASYRCAQIRMDTVQASADGVATIKAGEPRISAPAPPAPDAGHTAIAHVFVGYRPAELSADAIYPITETAEQAVTATTPGRIPKTLAKLASGQPVTIVCWGDSVTAGGNASKPELQYVDVFAAGLRSRFPQAQLEVKNISAGGSNSHHWLFPEKFPYRGLRGSENPARFEHVLAARPDLVTIEFVNDASLSAAQVEEVYSEILQRLAPTGAEVILITPHFTMWKMMGFKSMREPERRPYVLALRDFANRHQLGLADAAARWEHLSKEGLPYLTLLHNTINHPDDRGHRLFAEELWMCFR